MIGDLLFYRMHQPTLGDELITLYEGKHTDFVHVAIQVSDTRKIEASFNGGVVLNNLSNSRIDATYTPKRRPRGPQLNVLYGIDWLQKQVGQDYGYGDIVDVLLHYPVFECHYDCSALAAAFLTKIDALKDTESTFHMYTPQSLADKLGVK